MGYTTDFFGSVTVTPPLTAAEISYLTKFNQTRRMACQQGPYYVDRGGFAGQEHGSDVLNFNRPPLGQPGLWCQWVPTENGSEIEWDGGEKFYDADEWMRYLIDHFLRPNAIASAAGDPQFADFTFDHIVDGEIEAQGEDNDDCWLLVVTNNEVTTKAGTVVYGQACPPLHRLSRRRSSALR